MSDEPQSLETLEERLEHILTESPRIRAEELVKRLNCSSKQINAMLRMRAHASENWYAQLQVTRDNTLRQIMQDMATRTRTQAPPEEREAATPDSHSLGEAESQSEHPLPKHPGCQHLAEQDYIDHGGDRLPDLNMPFRCRYFGRPIDPYKECHKQCRGYLPFSEPVPINPLRPILSREALSSSVTHSEIWQRLNEFTAQINQRCKTAQAEYALATALERREQSSDDPAQLVAQLLQVRAEIAQLKAEIEQRWGEFAFLVELWSNDPNTPDGIAMASLKRAYERMRILQSSKDDVMQLERVVIEARKQVQTAQRTDQAIRHVADVLSTFVRDVLASANDPLTNLQLRITERAFQEGQLCLKPGADSAEMQRIADTIKRMAVD